MSDAGYPAARKTNVMAILALVFAFVFAPLGIVFGAVGLGQIRQTGEDGAGLAKAGLVLGIVLTVLGLVLVLGGLAAVGGSDDIGPAVPSP